MKEKLETRKYLQGCSVDVGLINVDVFIAYSKTLSMRKSVKKFENSRNLLCTVLAV